MPRIISDYKGQAKSRIVDAAMVAFSKRGYRNATMAGIARDVGVTKADLYHYFPSKAAILKEMAIGYRNVFRKSLSEAMWKAESVEELTNLIMKRLDQEAQGGARLWFDLITESADDAELAEILRGQLSEYLAAVKLALTKIPKSSGVSTGRSFSDSVAMSLMFLLIGLHTGIRLGTPRMEIRDALYQGLRAIFV